MNSLKIKKREVQRNIAIEIIEMKKMPSTEPEFPISSRSFSFVSLRINRNLAFVVSSILLVLLVL